MYESAQTRWQVPGSPRWTTTEARLAGDPVRAARLGPLRLGRAVYSAAEAFWSSVAESPDLPASWAP